MCSLILKLYDEDKSSSFHANEVIEVAGFLSLKSDNESMDEDDTGYINSPVIHVIHLEPGSSTFCHMLDLHKGNEIATILYLTVIYFHITFHILLESIFQNARTLRDELWIMLTDILLGDTLAADYLICHLISSV